MILLALILGLLAIDRFIAFGLAQVYARSGESPLAQVRAARADTVVVGTSTGRYAFVADVWPSKLVNLAQNGQTVFFSIAAAIAMRDAPSVRNILVAIDPYDFVTGIDNPAVERIWRIAPLIYNDLDTSDLLRKSRPVSAAPIALASWRFRGATDEIVKKFGKVDPPQIKPLPAKPQKIPSLSNEPPRRKPRIHRSLVKYIQALRRFSIETGRVLTIVVTPAYLNPRWNQLDQEPLIDEFVAMLQGARVCDLTKLRGTDFESIITTEENFHDGIHMSRQGALAYTAFVAKQMKLHCKETEAFNQN